MIAYSMFNLTLTSILAFPMRKWCPQYFGLSAGVIALIMQAQIVVFSFLRDDNSSVQQDNNVNFRDIVLLIIILEIHLWYYVMMNVNYMVTNYVVLPSMPITVAICYYKLLPLDKYLYLITLFVIMALLMMYFSRLTFKEKSALFLAKHKMQ